MSRDDCKPVFLVGATAVGKSDVALLLAEEINAEIVSADSMQVYRGMDIGTAKPSIADRKRVPHHVIDVVDVRQPFDVAQYRDHATSAIRDIQRRGRVPLVVGGSGMYLRVLTEGLLEAPGGNVDLRSKLDGVSREELFERLRKVDPVSAERIGTGNKRRLIRALEVFELTGKPISAQQREWVGGESTKQPMICLERERSELYARIEKRVDWMFDNGLVEEAQRLIAQGITENPTARVAAGYREVIEMLNGQRNRAETIARTKTRTRQLAKRQLTWFRHQATLRVLKAAESPSETKERVRELIENARR